MARQRLQSQSALRGRMSVIVGYTVSTAASEFGQVLRNCEFAQIKLDHLASNAANASLVRYLWVHEGDPPVFRETLEASAI